MTATEALQVFVKNILKNFTISMDFDRAYGSQCVDLIRYWLSFLALSQISTKPSGGAADLIKNTPANMKVLNVSNPQPGDIFVMPKSSVLPWGHTGIVTSTIRSDGKVSTIEANWDGKASNPPLKMDKTVTKFSGLIRPPQFSVPEENEEKEKETSKYVTWRAKKLTNVRAEATSLSAIVGSRILIAGSTFLGFSETEKGQDPYNDGRNLWVKSAKGNYVWADNVERV